MKKITSLLLAGIVAMAFAAVADAGTVTKIKAPEVTNTKTTINVTNNIYTNSTSSANLGNTDYGHASWYATGHSGSMQDKMDATKASMVSAGWSASTSTSYNSSNNYTYRTDTFTRVRNIVTTTTSVDTQVATSQSISYAMIDGQLVKKQNTNITETVTTTNVINTDRRTETQTVTGNGEPITLDTTNTGKITTARNEWLAHSPSFYSEFASKFDFTGDGIPDNCEWVANNPDALLCMPVKGQINGVTELFGNLGGYANGFDKLSVLCDKDNNGIVEGEELNGLMLWVDSNRNGIADAGELKTLESYGITKFYTEHKNFVGKYETSDGQTHTMWAWFPSLQQ